jgi:hypothetical protein
MRRTAPATEAKDFLPAGLVNVTVIGGAPSETQQRMDWRQAGLNVQEPTIADVEGGIDRVTRLLKEDRLRVFRDCRGLIDELGRYSRKMDAEGNPTDEIQDKRHYHRLDALRYAATTITDKRTILIGWA